MDVLSAIVRFFQQGGAFMYPILIVFGLGVAIAIERWTYLTVSGASNRSLWKKIVPYLKAGNFQEAAAVTNRSRRRQLRRSLRTVCIELSLRGDATTSRRRWKRA